MPAPKVRSKDQVQQRLRDHKRQWNSVYKDFSQKLKAFKDGLNGRGNAKFNLPPSNIKEPLPNEIGSYLQQLSGEFQKIVGDAEGVIAEQAEYARTRRRRKPKGPSPVPAGPVPAAPEATQEAEKVDEALSRLGGNNQYNLISRASRLSRFWQYLTSIFSNKDFNKQRIGLLSQSADLYYSLLDLENDVLSISVNSIPKAVAAHKKFKYNLDSFIGTYAGTKSMVERKATEEGIEKPVLDKEEEERERAERKRQKILLLKNEKEQAKVNQKAEEASSEHQKKDVSPGTILPPELDKIRHDLHLLFNAGIAKEHVTQILSMFDEYESEVDNGTRELWSDRIQEQFEALMKKLIPEIQKRFGPLTSTKVDDLINHIKKNTKKAELISEYMVKTSHNSVTRFLKRDLVKTLRYNKTAPVRLQLADLIDGLKEVVVKIMDNLEKGLSIGELDVLIEALREEFLKLKQPLHVLNVFYMKNFFERKEKSKQKNKQRSKELETETDEERLMDYVLQRKLRRELSQDLT